MWWGWWIIAGLILTCDVVHGDVNDGPTELIAHFLAQVESLINLKQGETLKQTNMAKVGKQVLEMFKVRTLKVTSLYKGGSVGQKFFFQLAPYLFPFHWDRREDKWR